MNIRRPTKREAFSRLITITHSAAGNYARRMIISGLAMPRARIRDDRDRRFKKPSLAITLRRSRNWKISQYLPRHDKSLIFNFLRYRL
jgi:hypothetical protein